MHIYMYIYINQEYILFNVRGIILNIMIFFTTLYEKYCEKREKGESLIFVIKN